jgi:hypothetical protein
MARSTRQRNPTRVDLLDSADRIHVGRRLAADIVTGGWSDRAGMSRSPGIRKAGGAPFFSGTSRRGPGSARCSASIPRLGRPSRTRRGPCWTRTVMAERSRKPKPERREEPASPYVVRFANAASGR